MAGAPEPKSESRMSTADEYGSVGGVGPVIDPTKNVLDLVRAESKYQDFAREAVAKRADDLRAAETRRVVESIEAETRRQDELRNLETKRSDDLRIQKGTYEVRMETLVADFTKQQTATTSDFQKQIAAILAAQTAKDALLLSQAVDKLTTSTDSRLAAVERNQYIVSGTSAVRDPAVTDALTKMSSTIEALSKTHNTTEGKEVGRGEIVSWFAVAIAIVVGIVTLFAKLTPPQGIGP